MWQTSQPLGNVLSSIIELTQSGATIRWVDEKTIISAGISPWTDIPLMAPTHPDFRYFLDVCVEKALDFGLTTRPLIETIAPLLQWDRSRRDKPLKGGLSENQEALLLGTAF
jgi:2'-hydroxyisoflavone reductase